MIFKCDCGYPEYLEIERDEDYLSICFIQQPKSLLDRLKGLFRHTHYVNEIYLSGDDIKRFKKLIAKL